MKDKLNKDKSYLWVAGLNFGISLVLIIFGKLNFWGGFWVGANIVSGIVGIMRYNKVEEDYNIKIKRGRK